VAGGGPEAVAGVALGDDVAREGGTGIEPRILTPGALRTEAATVAAIRDRLFLLWQTFLRWCLDSGSGRPGPHLGLRPGRGGDRSLGPVLCAHPGPSSRRCGHEKRPESVDGILRPQEAGPEGKVVCSCKAEYPSPQIM
jgi:hypothetical protein